MSWGMERRLIGASARRGAKGTKSALQVLDRAFSVLHLFTAEQPEWTVSQAALALELPISTTHRVLGVLLQHGFLARDRSTKRFRLGVAAQELGARGRATVDTRLVFADALGELSHETGETAMLCIPDEVGAASFCVDRIETQEALRLSVQPGRKLPLYAGAMGKALLAFMHSEQVARILDQPLEKICTRTITNPARLRSELNEIVARGYATSIEETNLGLWGVAVPILDARGLAYASIGTAGPLVRFAADQLDRQLASCRRAAATIASALGLKTWSPPDRAKGSSGRAPTGRRVRAMARKSA